MREAGFAGPLVLRADVIPQVDRDDGGLVIFMDNEREAVIEYGFFVRDLDLVGLRGCESEKQECGDQQASGATRARVRHGWPPG